MFHGIQDLFRSSEIPRDEAGCLKGVGTLLAPLTPALLLLADRSGRVLAATCSRDGLRREDELVATELAARLSREESCVWSHGSQESASLAFGLRLPTDAEGAILGGLLASSASAESQLLSLANSLRICGTLAWTVLDQYHKIARLQARVRQLIAEGETLKASQAAAVQDALEQRELRERDQAAYMAHLEHVAPATTGASTGNSKPAMPAAEVGRSIRDRMLLTEFLPLPTRNAK